MLDLGKIAYEAWWREAGEHVGPLDVAWEDLPQGLRSAWHAALEAAFEAREAQDEEG